MFLFFVILGSVTVGCFFVCKRRCRFNVFWLHLLSVCTNYELMWPFVLTLKHVCNMCLLKIYCTGAHVWCLWNQDVPAWRRKPTLSDSVCFLFVICRYLQWELFSLCLLSLAFIDESWIDYQLLSYLKQTNQLLSCSLSACYNSLLELTSTAER